MSLSKCAALALMFEEEEDEEAQFLLKTLYTNEETHQLFKSRATEGAFNNLIRKHLFTNEQKFREYLRLSTELFQEVLSLTKKDISSNVCNRRKNPISEEEKLCLTLRYLATGESYRSLAFQFRISHSWIGHIIDEVLQSIVQNLMPVHMPELTTAAYQDVEQVYHKVWGFPNCCGAIDGKHVRIVCPKKSGSAFYCYKKYFSTVLLAIVDGNYRFIAVDVGSYGREGDSGIFLKSNMGKKILSATNFPQPKCLPHTRILQPHVIIGDAAFALSENIMKPYPSKQALRDNEKAVYNYRHCRARRTSENAFGIMCQYFRVFFTPIACGIKSVNKLILACCILHNMLRTNNIPHPNEDSKDLKMPEENLIDLAATNERRASFNAFNVRHNFTAYFNSTNGSLSWQRKKVNRKS